MTDWDINPEGVSQVLQATYDQAMKLETLAGNYGSYLQGAASHAGGLIADAMNGFAINYNRSFNAIASQVIASMTGAKDATVAYLDGHYEMALNAQRGANGAFDQQSQADAQKIEDDMYSRELDRKAAQAESEGSSLSGGGASFDSSRTEGKTAEGADEAEPYTGTGGTSTVDSGRTPGGAG